MVIKVRERRLIEEIFVQVWLSSFNVYGSEVVDHKTNEKQWNINTQQIIKTTNVPYSGC